MASIEVLTPERAALLTDALSPYHESDGVMDANGCITEKREVFYARVLNGRFEHGSNTETLKVFCPTNIWGPPNTQFEYYMRYPRIYMVQFSGDGGKSWRNFMRVTPHNPGPPKPDLTGMTPEEAMAALRAWTIARIQAGAPMVPSPSLGGRWFLGTSGVRILDITPA